MFGIDSPELLVIALVALVVIGPKELPGMLRSWGKWMAQARAMASEFRGHVDDMVRQSELDEVKKQLESAPGLDLQALDPTKEIRSAIQDGMAEGQKAIDEAKSTIDNPLAEPESAPQIAAEPTPAETPRLEAAIEPAPPPVVAETAPAPVAEAAPVPTVEDKPAKAAAAG
ncbi:Sec-independent protein translocase protein TatB [Reyranella sp.]|uniref:Sec-independent protein translocase protein TatB n=1 Tax=Reyranella sp. TaxID=1929291 RepID=UPI0037847178